MNITLVISSLGCGGAERVLSTMANYWAEEKQVTLITIGMSGRDFFPLDSQIRRVGLNLLYPSNTLQAVFKNNMLRVFKLRRAIKDSSPDVVICFQDRTNVLTILATIGLSVPLIVSERTITHHHMIGLSWDRLRRWIYHRAYAVVVQTNKVKEIVSEYVPRDQIIVIPNPVKISADKINSVKQEYTQSSFNLRTPFVVAMGRLAVVKGFDLLLEAFAKNQHRNWFLVIIGDGPERGHLESMANQLEIDDRVQFLGQVATPSNILSKAALFVLSSRYEGFPNALLEAMSIGLPVISFDCPVGPGEIIENGVNGVLVPPEKAKELASAMDNLMSNESERRRLGAQAKKIGETYSIDAVMNQWDNILKPVCR